MYKVTSSLSRSDVCFSNKLFTVDRFSIFALRTKVVPPVYQNEFLINDLSILMASLPH
jgi:hypothetical protein